MFRKREAKILMIKRKTRSNLSSEQKLFIADKIRSLGSLEKARLFYRRDDVVSSYARHLAEKIYK